jgi:hypothetical protein
MDRFRPAAIVDFQGERRAVRITGDDGHGLVVEPPPPIAERSSVTVLAASAKGQVHKLIARVVWRSADAMGLVFVPRQSFSIKLTA